MHGGKQQQAKGRRDVALAKSAAVIRRRFGIPLDVDPHAALKGMVAEAAGNVEVLRGALVTFGDAATEADAAGYAAIYRAVGDGLMLREVYEAWCDRLVKFCAEAVKAGLAEREVRIVEEQGAAVVRLIEAVIEDAALGLNPEQKQTARTLAAVQLRSLATAG